MRAGPMGDTSAVASASGAVVACARIVGALQNGTGRLRVAIEFFLARSDIFLSRALRNCARARCDWPRIN